MIRSWYALITAGITFTQKDSPCLHFCRSPSFFNSDTYRWWWHKLWICESVSVSCAVCRDCWDVTVMVIIELFSRIVSLPLPPRSCSCVIRSQARLQFQTGLHPPPSAEPNVLILQAGSLLVLIYTGRSSGLKAAGRWCRSSRKTTISVLNWAFLILCYKERGSPINFLPRPRSEPECVTRL